MTLATATRMVSIIIPAYNDEKLIHLLLESLLNQNYPLEMYEVIVVDNNSTDQTKSVVQKHPVTLLEEAGIQSSYAARNKGIRQAQGEILAFIDSDCIASSNWISEGVRALEKADLVGGRVEFYFSKKKTAAECYDSLIHFRFDNSIRERKVTGAGNLFVKSSVFKKVGFFPEVASGGDFHWTGKAAANGFSLIHAPKAIVRHPARQLKELLKKQLRTGGGKPNIWFNNKERLWRWSHFLTLISPPRPSHIRRLIDQRGQPDMNKKFWGIWMVCYICQVYFLFGILSGIAKISAGGKKKK